MDGSTQGQLRRYYFIARLAFLIAIGLGVLIMNVWAGFATWLLVPDLALVAVLGWAGWQERGPIGFLLAWRSVCRGIGLGHKFKVINGKGQMIEKQTLPKVRRLYWSAGVVRAHVIPVAGKALDLEARVEDLTRLLGMSHGEIVERRTGWRSVRFVMEFTVATGSLIEVATIAAPRRYPGLDGAVQPVALPSALRALALPDGSDTESYETREVIKVESERLPLGSDTVDEGGGIDWREFLSAVPLGVKADGSPWTHCLYDRQGLLVVGLSGAGKSGVFWSLNIGLAPALIAGVVELWGIDRKGDELYHGREFFARYADGKEECIELLEKAVRDMETRKEYNRAAGQRKYTPSIETPLVVIEIDEMMMFAPEIIGDSKLAKRASAAINELLTQGRSKGFYVVAGIQDPRKEYLNMRALFGTSVCMRLDNDMARLVLSTAAVKNGANCEAIPEDAQGVGYVLEGQAQKAIRVRSFWASEEDITAWETAIAIGRAEDSQERRRTTQKALERVRSSGPVGSGEEREGAGEHDNSRTGAAALTVGS